MMDNHQPPITSDLCTSCTLRQNRSTTLADLETRYRCQDCLHHPDLCVSCVKDLHVFAPAHILWKWDTSERIWAKVKITDVVGFVINLGHGGLPCRMGSTNQYTMVIVHERGMTSIPVRFCGCPCPAARWKEEKAYQLLAHGLFPGSWESPRTAFTLPLLRCLDLLILQTQASFVCIANYLRRLTDNVNVHEVPVCSPIGIHAVLGIEPNLYRIAKESYLRVCESFNICAHA